MATAFAMVRTMCMCRHPWLCRASARGATTWVHMGAVTLTDLTSPQVVFREKRGVKGALFYVPFAPIASERPNGDKDACFSSIASQCSRSLRNEFERASERVRQVLPRTPDRCTGSSDSTTERQRHQNRAVRNHQYARRLPLLGRSNPWLRLLGDSTLCAKHLGHQQSLTASDHSVSCPSFPKITSAHRNLRPA